jgi:hypothetical protein
VSLTDVTEGILRLPTLDRSQFPLIADVACRSQVAFNDAMVGLVFYLPVGTRTFTTRPVGLLRNNVGGMILRPSTTAVDAHKNKRLTSRLFRRSETGCLKRENQQEKILFRSLACVAENLWTVENGD